MCSNLPWLGRPPSTLRPCGSSKALRSADRRDGTYRLQVEELHRAMPALLQELRRQGAQLSELENPLGHAGGRVRIADRKAPAR